MTISGAFAGFENELSALWSRPRQARIPVVQTVARRCHGRFGPRLDGLHRFDVLFLDDATQRIIVEIDLTPLFAARRQMRFELQRGMLAPKEPLRPKDPPASLLDHIRSFLLRRS